MSTSRWRNADISQLSFSSNDMNWDPKSAPKLDFEEDYYSVIEVSPTIDSKALKKAYYKIVFKYHPDNKEGEAAKSLCNKQMMVINNAYKVLKDETTRKIYDAKRMFKSSQRPNSSRTNENNNSKSSYTSSSSSSSYDSFNKNDYNRVPAEPVESLSDILKEMWREYNNNGSFFFDDMMDFLEGNIGNGNEWANAFERQSSLRQVEEVQDEINLLQKAISNLQIHLGNLKRLYVEEKSGMEVDIKKDKVKKSLEDIEKSLKNGENLKSLRARILEVEDQIKKCQRQLDDCNKDLIFSNIPRSDTRSKKSTSQYSDDTKQNSPKISIEQELNILKKKMGLK